MTASHRLSGRAVWLLSRASLRGTRLAHERFARHGLRKQHYGVLAGLADSGAATQASLADRLGLDRSDMVALLDELERRGLVLRTAAPADRRCKIVKITAAGEGVLGELDDLVFAAEDELLTPLDAAERQTLVALLAKIVPELHTADKPAPEAPPDGKIAPGDPPGGKIAPGDPAGSKVAPGVPAGKER